MLVRPVVGPRVSRLVLLQRRQQLPRLLRRRKCCRGARPARRWSPLRACYPPRSLHSPRAAIATWPLEPKSDVEAVEVKATDSGNDRHWKNFLECVGTRGRPISDIERCHRSSSTCHLGNIALRSKMRIDWDDAKGLITQTEVRKYHARVSQALKAVDLGAFPAIRNEPGSY